MGKGLRPDYRNDPLATVSRTESCLALSKINFDLGRNYFSLENKQRSYK